MPNGKKGMGDSGIFGGIYGMAFIGAAILFYPACLQPSGKERLDSLKPFFGLPCLYTSCWSFLRCRCFR